jgi:hypothetical protein
MFSLRPYDSLLSLYERTYDGGIPLHRRSKALTLLMQVPYTIATLQKGLGIVETHDMWRLEFFILTAWGFIGLGFGMALGLVGFIHHLRAEV